MQIFKDKKEAQRRASIALLSSSIVLLSYSTIVSLSPENIDAPDFLNDEKIASDTEVAMQSESTFYTDDDQLTRDARSFGVAFNKEECFKNVDSTHKDQHISITFPSTKLNIESDRLATETPNCLIQTFIYAPANKALRIIFDEKIKFDIDVSNGPNVERALVVLSNIADGEIISHYSMTFERSIHFSGSVQNSVSIPHVYPCSNADSFHRIDTSYGPYIKNKKVGFPSKLNVKDVIATFRYELADCTI